MPAKITDEQALAKYSAPISANGCIEWMGGKDKDGYPVTNRRSDRFGRISKAHRLAYILRFGPIPPGLEVDHTCRNRSCVNPDHLEPVTHEVNVKRGVHGTANHRNTRKTHCIHGHPLIGCNLKIEIWNGIVMRKCRQCCNDRRKKYPSYEMRGKHNVTR